VKTPSGPKNVAGASPAQPGGSDSAVPPQHLRPPTAAWWSSVLRDYLLEPHHVRLLTLAAEAWDRGQQAREAIEEHGITFLDRFGQPRARPEVAIERDARIGFARALRELGLDVAPPSEAPRSTGITPNASLRKVG
jgi:phage terminase small subunit